MMIYNGMFEVWLKVKIAVLSKCGLTRSFAIIIPEKRGRIRPAVPWEKHITTDALEE